MNLIREHEHIKHFAFFLFFFTFCAYCLLNCVISSIFICCFFFLLFLSPSYLSFSFCVMCVIIVSESPAYSVHYGYVRFVWPISIPFGCHLVIFIVCVHKILFFSLFFGGWFRSSFFYLFIFRPPYPPPVTCCEL